MPKGEGPGSYLLSLGAMVKKNEKGFGSLHALDFLKHCLNENLKRTMNALIKEIT